MYVLCEMYYVKRFLLLKKKRPPLHPHPRSSQAQATYQVTSSFFLGWNKSLQGVDPGFYMTDFTGLSSKGEVGMLPQLN